MCLLVPRRVVSVGTDRVTVDIGGRIRDTFVAPDQLEELAAGDHVLVAGGVVIRRLDAEQARIVASAAVVADGPGD